MYCFVLCCGIAGMHLKKKDLHAKIAHEKAILGLRV
jgi:hypothetical protein